MFKKFSSLPDPKERLEIFNLLKFNLALGRRLAEFLTLATLIAAFGWFIERTSSAPPSSLAYTAPVIGLALLVFVLPRWLFLVVESALVADFGLDPRPAGRRLAALANQEIRWLPAAWLLSVLMFHLLIALPFWGWVLAALALGAGLFLLDTFKPGLLRPESLRPPLEGEVASDLSQLLEKWSQRMGLKPWPIRVATTVSPYLSPPRLSGLGPTQTLIIPESALVAFVPRALNLLTLSAVMEGLVKAPLKLFFLRACALLVALPLAAIFISALGRHLWLYPFTYNPALISLVWLAVWFGLTLADLFTRIVRRDLEVQLAAAAAIVLKDDEAAGSARSALAVKNLEEDAPPAWRNMFSRRYSLPVFFKRFQYYRRRNAESAFYHPVP